jgi:hypothetical protein
MNISINTAWAELMFEAGNVLDRCQKMSYRTVIESAWKEGKDGEA